MDVFQLNLYTNCRNSPIHAILGIGSDDLATGSDDLLGSIGFLWQKKLFLEKNGGVEMLFQF